MNQRDLLGDLNEQQREAVLHTEGPLLVLAGAGSGKTRVIAHRVAYLLKCRGVRSEQIAAVTFTNKAADEMRERIRGLVGAVTRELSVRTFHSLCLWILRREAGALGYPNCFVIYDELDQLALARNCLRSLGPAGDAWSPREIVARISSAKNMGVGPREYATVNRSPSGDVLGSLYEEYERRLRAAHAMDFDDLILKTLELFQARPETGGRYSERYRYLLVDEYQDTNRPQHLLVKALAGSRGNVCVVGDEDQSIYGFRGADIGNILRFGKEFPNTRIIKLERNYRSTRRILEAASRVVDRNRERIGKTLWSGEEEGELLELFRAPSDWEEAVWVADRIRQLRREPDTGEIAILYRTNSQSRTFEEALGREGIPYRMVGGIRFYERKEVKDLLAYLRILIDPADDVSLERILNVPPRELGRVTFQALERVRERERIPLWEAIRSCREERGLPARSLRALETFHRLLEDLRKDFRADHPVEALRTVLERTAYPEYLRSVHSGEEAQERWQNVEELISGLAGFEGIQNGLQLFLDQTSLLGETDEFTGSGPVVLMTIHSAKGMEFPATFLVGMEEGLLPHSRSQDSPVGIEEERRLFYVGLTRAKKRVFLTYASTRRARGTPERRKPSPFLSEIPAGLIRDRSLPAGIGTRTAPRWDSRRDPGGGFSSPFALGQRVRHPTLGPGTILRMEGSGEDMKLTISFPGMPARKFLLRCTRLEPEPSENP